MLMFYLFLNVMLLAPVFEASFISEFDASL